MPFTSTYRYSLDTSSRKYPCPSCGKKRFVPFVDNETGEMLLDYGRCDRENECGFFGKPWQDEGQPTRIIKYVKSEVPQLFVSWQEVVNSMERANNSFIDFLTENFGKDSTNEAIEKYYLGSRGGDVLFWQIDNQNRVCNAKQMSYLTCGRRDKNGINKHLYTATNGYKTTLFGAHLLNPTVEKIGVVESEKSAVIASIVYPELVWLATCGANGFTTEKMNTIPLKGKVYLHPDADSAGREGFSKAELNLKRRGIDVELIDQFVGFNDGRDIADEILSLEEIS